MSAKGCPDHPTSPRAIRRAERIATIRAMQAARFTNTSIAETLRISPLTLGKFIKKWGVQRAKAAR